jgi:hypothetical protein
VSDVAAADGTVDLLYAPEGRDDAPLAPDEIARVRWLIEHQAEIHESVRLAVFRAYPGIRKEVRAGHNEEVEANRLAPPIDSPEGLRSLMGVVSFYVHHIEKPGPPYIGIELGCTWDDEHGLGVLLHGATALEVGGADTALLLWLAEQYAART